MNRIELRGVLVPSEYDGSWAEPYIARGVFTPESRFRAALAAADKTQPLEVYINSPGGSVMVGDEMANATLAWKAETGQAVNVTIGAMAASAAAVYAITVADRLRAYANAKMMFHGAYTLTDGGQGAHEDTAELLAKINGVAKARLVSRYALAPETVEQWFAEGRAGWLSATDMQAAGIASEIIGSDDARIEFSAADAAAIGQRGMAIAACYAALQEGPKNDGGDEKHVPTAPGADGDQAGDGGDPVRTCDGGTEGATVPDSDADAAGSDGADADAAFRAAIEAAKSEAVAELTAAYAEKCAAFQARAETAEAALRMMQSERDKAQAALAAERRTRAEELNKHSATVCGLQARLDKLLGGALAFSACPSTWPEALASCGGDYVKAAKTYPQLRDEYIRNHNQK